MGLGIAKHELKTLALLLSGAFLTVLNATAHAGALDRQAHGGTRNARQANPYKKRGRCTTSPASNLPRSRRRQAGRSRGTRRYLPRRYSFTRSQNDASSSGVISSSRSRFSAKCASVPSWRCRSMALQ